MNIVTAIQMQALDRRTIMEARVPSLTLMERAGSGALDVIESLFAPVAGKRVTIVCGKGNNGGDGLVVARLLRRRRAIVKVLLMDSASALSRDAAAMYRRWIRIGGASATTQFRSKEQAEALLAGSDILIDALLGTGLSSEVIGVFGDIIRLMNRAGRPIVAIDMPSGIHADDGRLLGHAVRATATVTFALPKVGLYLGAGIDHAGEIGIEALARGSVIDAHGDAW